MSSTLEPVALCALYVDRANQHDLQGLEYGRSGRLGDEICLAVEVCVASGEMQLTAMVNGVLKVAPTVLTSCSFAMELWPYVAVCGHVTEMRLVRCE